MVLFDTPHVFRVFGGPKGLLTTLDRYLPGHGLVYNTIQMWERRETIPTRWVGAVLYCIEQTGHECFEFLTDDDEFGLSSAAPDSASSGASRNARSRR